MRLNKRDVVITCTIMDAGNSVSDEVLAKALLDRLQNTRDGRYSFDVEEFQQGLSDGISKSIERVIDVEEMIRWDGHPDIETTEVIDGYTCTTSESKWGVESKNRIKNGESETFFYGVKDVSVKTME